MTRKASTRKDKREKILVVEDDRSLREGLAMNLRLRKYHVITAVNGDEGMQMAFDERPDLIIMDIMMPSWSGLDILEEMRKREEKTPVLILSAKNTTQNKVQGLDLGADDYLGKPFDLPELIARVEALLRRQRAKEESLPELAFKDLVIDQSARNVKINGKTVELSAKEFDILCLLASSPGAVFSRETILEKVWGWDYEGSERTVDNFVASLRKKLNPGRRRNPCIRTVPKVGYKFETP